MNFRSAAMLQRPTDQIRNQSDSSNANANKNKNTSTNKNATAGAGATTRSSNNPNANSNSNNNGNANECAAASATTIMMDDLAGIPTFVVVSTSTSKFKRRQQRAARQQQQQQQKEDQAASSSSPSTPSSPSSASWPSSSSSFASCESSVSSIHCHDSSSQDCPVTAAVTATVTATATNAATAIEAADPCYSTEDMQSSHDLHQDQKVSCWAWKVTNLPYLTDDVRPSLQHASLALPSSIDLATIASRICTFCKVKSITCLSTSCAGRLDAYTKCGRLKVRLQLWKGKLLKPQQPQPQQDHQDHHHKQSARSMESAAGSSIVIEVQRLQGCCIAMKWFRTNLYSAILKGQVAPCMASASESSTTATAAASKGQCRFKIPTCIRQHFQRNPNSSISSQQLQPIANSNNYNSNNQHHNKIDSEGTVQTSTSITSASTSINNNTATATAIVTVTVNDSTTQPSTAQPTITTQQPPPGYSECMQKCVELLESEHVDQNHLGMDYLVSCTDPEKESSSLPIARLVLNKVDHVFAARLQAIVFGFLSNKAAEDECNINMIPGQKFGGFSMNHHSSARHSTSANMMSSSDDGTGSTDEQEDDDPVVSCDALLESIQVLAWRVLSNSLQVIGNNSGCNEEDEKSSACCSQKLANDHERRALWTGVLHSMLNCIHKASSRPQTAALAIVSLRWMYKLCPDAVEPIVHDGTVQESLLLPALEYGKAHHLELEQQTLLLLSETN